MMSTKTYIPEHYAPLLNLYDTQKAIGLLKRVFEDTLCGSLHLRRRPSARSGPALHPRPGQGPPGERDHHQTGL